jgi:hypothetical protein
MMLVFAAKLAITIPEIIPSQSYVAVFVAFDLSLNVPALVRLPKIVFALSALAIT